MNTRTTLRAPDLTLAQLRSFCVIARAGSYAAAARQLKLTSPAVWEQIHGLERHYQQRLVVRRGNGVALTQHGDQLLRQLQPILAGLESTKAALAEMSGHSPKRLTVATNLRVLAEEISASLGAFRRRWPEIRLHLSFTSDDVDQRVADGRADVGFTLEPGPEDEPQLALVYEPAAEVDYLLVVPQGHPLASRRTLRLAHIAEERLVLAHETAYSRRRVQEVFHRHKLTDRLKLAAETSSDEYTLPCIRAGLGVGITVGTGRGPLFAGLEVRKLTRWFGTARLGFVWKRGAHVMEVQRALAREIQTSIG